MIVTFETKSHHRVTLFGDVALTLLELMGLSGNVPSALAPSDVGEALHKLRAEVQRRSATDDTDVVDDGEERNVSLKNRALPLIELLEAADRDKAYVTWEEGRSPA